MGNYVRTPLDSMLIGPVANYSYDVRASSGAVIKVSAWAQSKTATAMVGGHWLTFRPIRWTLATAAPCIYRRHFDHAVLTLSSARLAHNKRLTPRPPTCTWRLACFNC